MDEDGAARRWQVELELRAAENAIELRVKIRLVVVAVSLTIGGSAAIAWATQAVGSSVTFTIMLGCALGLLFQVRALRILERRHGAAAVKALLEADRLMKPGGDMQDDGPADQA